MKKFRVVFWFFIWIVLFFLSSPLFSLHYNFRAYGLEEGLGQSQVYCIFQDSTGFLWIGTEGGGLGKCDGKTIKNLTAKDGLITNIIYAIMEDRYGNLWLGTDKGVIKYDRLKFIPYNNTGGLTPETMVWFIQEDQDGDLWFSTEGNGVVKYSEKTGFKNYTEKDGLVHNNVFCSCEDRNGNIWFGTEKGLSEFNKTTGTFTNHPIREGLTYNRIRFILKDNNKDLWIATRGGVAKYDGQTFSLLTTKDGLVDDRVISILQDNRGHYWFTTENGVSEYDGKKFINYTTKNGLSHNLVSAVMQDREGNLWFGTDFGLSKLSGKMFTYLTQKDGLQNDWVWAFWEHPDGTLWISTEKTMAKYTNRDTPIKNFDFKHKIEEAYPLFEDRKGNLWFGDKAHNLWFWSAEDIARDNQAGMKNLTTEMGLEKHLVLDIFEDRFSNIWVATSEGGVILISGDSAKTIKKKDGLPHNIVNDITEDLQGNIIMGTEGGISIYNGKEFKNITLRDGLPTRYVMNTLVDTAGNLWCGTYGGGVVRYSSSDKEPGTAFDTFTVNDGLSDNVVVLMVFDDYGNLIIGTDNGINKLDVEEYEKTGKKVIKHYGRHEGFIGIECNQSAVYKDKHGNIWFGTVKGAIKYNPKEDNPNEKEPLTHITALKFFLEDVDLSKYSSGIDKNGLPIDLALPYEMNHISFEYTGICLTVPESVRYQVKLDGFEPNWTPISSSTSATYSNLSPGYYTFKVRARSDNKVWNKEPTVFSFQVIAPFWLKWWFFLLCFAAVAGGVYSIIKFRLSNLEKQQRSLEERINNRTLELKREKAKVEQINLELEQRVQERTEKLMMANKKLMQAQKMEAVGRLASGVAHDLNNVLAGVVTLPEILAAKTPPGDPMREYLLMIQSSGEKAAAIVRDLLTLARRGVAITEVVNLNDVIRDYLTSAEFSRLRSVHPEMEIETYLEEELHFVLGSPLHLSKTVMNLIVNAAEAMPSGGKIIITSGNRYLDHPVSGYEDVEEGKYIFLSVSDSGVGISNEDIEKIFEPFYTKKVMGRSGTGLGMAVVWGTVQDHKGYIEVQSEEGKGTTITIYLPITTRQKEEDMITEDRDFKSRGGHILVVDDEIEQREIASFILKELGFEVTTVSSGEKAVELVRKTKFDLVILDMIMEPGIDGCETFRRLIETSPSQKAIIVSGFSEDERVKKAQKMGAGSFVKKPYLKDEIYRAIKRQLG